MIERHQLEWKGPYSWFGDDSTNVFSCESSESAGIYGWTVPTIQGNLVYYVGETEAGLASRHLDHWHSYFSGVYTVNEPGLFGRGERRRLYKGYTYRRQPWRYMSEFTQHSDALVEAIQGMLRTMDIWVAELSAPRRIRRRIESSIVDLLYKVPGVVAAFQEPGMRRELRRPDEEPIIVSSQPSQLLIGLPEEFEA